MVRLLSSTDLRVSFTVHRFQGDLIITSHYFSYTILVSGATAIGPLCASFIVQYSPGGWIDYIWVCMALAGANCVGVFLFYPESNFRRPPDNSMPAGLESVLYASELSKPRDEQHGDTQASDQVGAGYAHEHTSSQPNSTVLVVPKSLRSIWTTFFTMDHSASLLRAFVQPLLMLLQPPVLLAILVYGTSLASQIILIFAFPSFLTAPPYLFSSSDVGLMQISAVIGFVLASIVGGYVADVITSRVIIIQKGAVHPEQRLISLAPGCFVAPCGCILVAFACASKLHWIAIAFGFGMGK